MRAKLAKEIELLQDVGNELREPYSKHLDDGIFKREQNKVMILVGCFIFLLLVKK